MNATFDTEDLARQMPGLDDTPLVAVTGYGQDEDVQRSREAGFAHHLVKPVDIEAMQRVLDALAHMDGGGSD